MASIHKKKIVRKIRRIRKREAEQTIAHTDGLPPTDNLRKHPDEVYGDTEIPDRGRELNQLKKNSH
jgi:hypothetical protein